MKKLALVAMACVSLAACNSDKGEKVYTVDELVANRDQIVVLLKACNNNPGELEKTANCQNARAALRAIPFNEARILIQRADAK